MNGEWGLSLNEIRSRIAQFVLDYKDATGERQDAQIFWRDLCTATALIPSAAAVFSSSIRQGVRCRSREDDLRVSPDHPV